jgi:DNA-binding LacI/PurR family transcriptional regulator
MAITQRELANRLGMSRQIVGHALNGHPRVAEETRRKVLKAAEQYGYTAQSNHEARALIARRYGKRVRHDMIAVMMAMGKHPGGLMRDMPYYAPVFHGIEEEAANRNVDVALHTFRLNYLPRYIREKRVDGVIAFASTPERNQGLYEEGIPLLTIGTHGEHSSSILADDYRGISLTTQHLIELGHRRIAYLGQGTNFEIGAERLRAFRDSMRSRGLKVPKELIEATLLQPFAANGNDGMKRLWRRTKNFTAVVCYNDNIAMGAIEFLQSAGIHVPQEVSVTGFDDVSCEYQFRPTLTSVSFDRRAMGRRAVAVFYELLEKMSADNTGAAPPLHHEVFPVQLVVRESTCAAQV